MELLCACDSTCTIFFGNSFPKAQPRNSPVNRSGYFLRTFSRRSLHSNAMTHHRFTIRLKCWFAAYKSYFTLSLSLSYATMVFQSPERPELLADSSTPSARPETACMSSSPPSCCMFFFFFYYLVRLNAT